VGCLAYRFPFEGSRMRAVFEPSSPRTSWPLMEFATLSSVNSSNVADILVTCTHLREMFPRPRRAFATAVLCLLTKTDSSSYEPRFSFRVRSCPAPAQLASWTPPLGSRSPSRHKSTKSTDHRVSHAQLRFALSVSHALDDFRLRTPRGLVSSHSHVQDSLFRGFPRCQADSPLRRAVPSCRFASFASRRVASALPAQPASPSGS